MLKVTYLALAIGAMGLTACGGGGGGSSNDTATGTGTGSTSGSADAGTGTGSTGSTDSTGGTGSTGDSGGTGSTGDSGGTSTGDVTLIGAISVDEFTTSNTLEAAAVFFQISQGLPAALIQANLAPTLDVCEVDVTQLGAPDPDDDLPDFDLPGDIDLSTVSAGDAIPIRSAGAELSRLVRGSLFGLTAYTPEPETAPGPMPADLSASIPGDVFPAFANVALPTVETFSLTAPLGPVTPTSVFTWVPGTTPDTYISLDVSSFDFINGTIVSVTCELTDDGAFTFPATTQAAMGADFESFGPASALRDRTTTLQQGNALLVLTTTSGD